MKSKLSTLLALVSLATVNHQLSTLHAQGTAFTYQGRLTDGTNVVSGTVELQLTLWSAVSGGTQVAAATPASTIVAVTNGLFTLPVDFGAGAFNGSDRYVQIELRTVIGPFTTLTPRQKITAAPYAVLAGNVAAGGIAAGTNSSAVTFNNSANSFSGSFSGNGAGLTNVSATTLGGLSASNFWKLGGNAGTTPGANFLGTTDNQALELKVGGLRVLRLEPATFATSSIILSNAPNVVGGSSVNTIDPGVVGSFIGGGGAGGYYAFNGTSFVSLGALTNRISTHLAVIGGGVANVIATNSDDSFIGGGAYNTIQSGSGSSVIVGGYANTISNAYNATIGGGNGNSIATNANYATIAGGAVNIISAEAGFATISGGNDNTNRAPAGTIGGGLLNHITSTGGAATISGGSENAAYGAYATVPGGARNLAYGNYSFAAGQRAKAQDQGAFVWADSQNADFASSANNQFLIRAAGGVGIGTPYPQTQLDVRSTNNTSQAQILAADQNADTWVQLWSGFNNGANPPAIIWPTGNMLRFLCGGISGSPANEFMRIDSAGNVGIGRASAANRLEVEGNASKTTATAWLANSDARIKTAVHTVTHALEKLEQVRPVEFRYTAEYRAQHPSIEDRPYQNVIAQEFQKVFPDAVKKSGDKLPDGEAILQVDTYPLTIYATAAIQELNQKLTTELLRRDTENAELKRRLERLEQLIDQRSGN